MVDIGVIWWIVVVFGAFWWHMVDFDGIYQIMAVFGRFWRHLVDLGSIWQTFVAFEFYRGRFYSRRVIINAMVGFFFEMGFIGKGLRVMDRYLCTNSDQQISFDDQISLTENYFREGINELNCFIYFHA